MVVKGSFVNVVIEKLQQKYKDKIDDLPLVNDFLPEVVWEIHVLLFIWWQSGKHKESEFTFNKKIEWMFVLIFRGEKKNNHCIWTCIQ